MNLKDYLQIMKKHLWLLIITVVIVTLGCYLFTVKQPITYDASSYINVLIKPAAEKPAYYEYDNYYSLQAGSLFTDRVLIWLQDPANVLDVYKGAKLQAPDVELKKLSKLINARKKNPATVVITVNQQNKDAAKDLADASAKIVSEKTKNLTKNESIKNIVLDISPTVVSEKKPAILVNTLIGLIAGIILGFALVFLAEYFRPKK